MTDYVLTKETAEVVFFELESELVKKPVLLITTKSAEIGKWGMTRLWRSWMPTIAKTMANEGVTMPLYIDKEGGFHGTRKFNKDDAHELLTANFLYLDEKGNRLSWAKEDHDGMRAATKSERFTAMMRCDEWATNRGILLFKPRESEYVKLENETNG